jgi:GR25 family glycosyltransferase involved in LPS biosynthesis
MAPLIYVINLDRDVERMASIRANLEALGLPFERLSAVMGKDVPEWEKLVDSPPMPGATGWTPRGPAKLAATSATY